jgi:hypothetical protein
MNDESENIPINLTDLINSIQIQVDELKKNNEKHIDIHDILFNDLSAIRICSHKNKEVIDTMRVYIKHFNNDSKEIQSRFESNQAQLKIFHSNIKDNKNKLEVLTRERPKNLEFDNRVNAIITDILTRLEKLESCEKQSPTEKSILKRLEKFENKLNDITIKYKQLDKQPDKQLASDKIEELEGKFSKVTATSNIQEKQLIEFERVITEFDTKQGQVISDIRRITDELENTRSVARKNREELRIFEKGNVSYKKEHDSKSKVIEKTLSKINSDMLNLTNIIKINSSDINKINSNISDVKIIISSISNKNVKDNIDLEQIKIRISNNEQQIIHHMNILSQNEHSIIQHASMLQHFNQITW